MMASFNWHILEASLLTVEFHYKFSSQKQILLIVCTNSIYVQTVKGEQKVDYGLQSALYVQSTFQWLKGKEAVQP